MLRVLPRVNSSQPWEQFTSNFCSEQSALRNWKLNVACASLNFARCGCSLGLVRVGVTGRDGKASCSSSRAGGLGFRGFSRVKCVLRLSFSGDLEDASPVSLEDVSLEELLEQVGAGDARDARGMVQIESNPHPSLLRRYSELDKPFERGRALPIPMPHKLNRPLPLPLSRRRLLPDAAVVRKSAKPSSSAKVETLSYPRLFAKILVVPDDEVRMVLDSWKGRNRCKSDSISNLILQLGRRDSAGKALQLFAWVREQPRLWPNDGILLAIILVVLESRKLTLANKFLAIYGPLSPESALVAANAYVEQGFITDALRILTSLEERGVSAGSALYVKMIMEAGEAGARGVVHDLVAGRRFKLEECTQVMTTCSRLGLDEEVEAVFQRYLDQELKPNIVMFTTLMQSRARAGKVRQALAVFWDMQEAGVKPDLIAYRVMIRLCEKAGDVNRAMKVYNEMRISGFVPTSDVYNVMIRLYCKEGRLAKAKEVIREMEMWGCAPTSDTIEHLSLAGYKLP
jgi:pentatricopeptide repeat protein